MSTYETDGVEKRDEIVLAIQAALVMKSLSQLVGCRSWLVAKLAMREVTKRLDELQSTVAKEGKP